jgi:hypothetical protein
MKETDQPQEVIAFICNHIIDNVFEHLNGPIQTFNYDEMMHPYIELPPEFRSMILRIALEQWKSGFRQKVFPAVLTY